MRTPFLLSLALLLLPSLAVAEPAPTPAPPSPAAKAGTASVEYVVGRGGGYEVTVSPTFVTVFYLPERVIKAFASNQKDFTITLMGDSVALRPNVDRPGLTANLNIDTKSAHISVVLKVGPADQAVSQVIFTRAAEKAQLDKKVQEALAPLRTQLEDEQRNVRTHIEAAAEQALAEAMAQTFVLQELDGIARNDAGVVVRVPRAVKVGEAVYVQLTIQNRSSAPYLVRRAVLVQDRRERSGRLVLLPREGDLGKVEAGQLGKGVLVVPVRDLDAGRPFELRLIEEPSGAPLDVGGLRAP